MPTTEAQLRFEVIAAYADVGASAAQAAEQLGVTRNAIYVTARVLGIKFADERHKRTAPTAAYMDGLRAGYTLKELSAKHGRSVASIAGALKRAGLPTCARLAIRQQSNSAQA